MGEKFGQSHKARCRKVPVKMRQLIYLKRILFCSWICGRDSLCCGTLEARKTKTGGREPKPWTNSPRFLVMTGQQVGTLDSCCCSVHCCLFLRRATLFVPWWLSFRSAKIRPIRTQTSVRRDSHSKKWFGVGLVRFADPLLVFKPGLPDIGSGWIDRTRFAQLVPGLSLNLSSLYLA